MSPSTTADPRVLDLVRARLERSLNFDYGGFAADQAKLISLGDVVLDGVHLDGEDDTVRDSCRSLASLPSPPLSLTRLTFPGPSTHPPRRNPPAVQPPQ